MCKMKNMLGGPAYMGHCPIFPTFFLVIPPPKVNIGKTVKSVQYNFTYKRECSGII